MNDPVQSLEATLAAYGDQLYHLALLAGGDETTATTLLLAAVRGGAATWRERAEMNALAAPQLLASMVVAARRAAARPVWRRRPWHRRRTALKVALPALQQLTLDQRLALGLHLLAGYDAARIAAILTINEDEARAALVAAVRTLGHAADVSLPDLADNEECAANLRALVAPAAGARQTIRSHLAACARCRAFDRAWDDITHRAESALRAALREQPLPEHLHARMLVLIRPPQRLDLRLHLTLPSLLVASLIAFLALPGFQRPPIQIREQPAVAPVDARALTAQALERHYRPPERNGIWYRRYETLWYFDNDLVAPLRAEIWLDPRHRARHRLQITHADGGAPYELQLGDGASRFYYAIDALYAPVQYGSLQTIYHIQSGAPTLLVQDLSPQAQEQALDARLSDGPWSIPLAYLHQARTAPDLRALGRQRDGERTVQILSFTGFSPLGLPPGTTDDQTKRVTVLLALDEDGLLRTATELIGPPGAEQTGQVTWRLVEEQTVTSNVNDVFAIHRAWTGLGSFDTASRSQSADPALPLIPADAVGEPWRLLRYPHIRRPVWMPAAPPAGIERALLLWREQDRWQRLRPQGLIYIGEGKRLTIIFNRARPVSDAETLTIEPWQVTLKADRPQRLTLALVRPDALRSGNGTPDSSAAVLIEAYGFARDELLNLVASLRQFDLQILKAHRSIFAPRPGSDDLESGCVGR